MLEVRYLQLLSCVVFISKMVRLKISYLFFLIFLSSCKYLDRNANYISDETVWSKIKNEAPLKGLNPTFVYAICHAESSLNANAESSVARGNDAANRSSMAGCNQIALSAGI